MGMQQKLDRAYKEGFEAGKTAAQPLIELRGSAQGAQATWDLVEKMFTEIEGIGPKTKEKILLAVQDYANKEKAKIINGGKR